MRLKLYKGSARVVGRQSPNSLYSLAHVTFEEDQVYDQRDAEGFIKLNALRLRLAGPPRPKLTEATRRILPRGGRRGRYAFYRICAPHKSALADIIFRR